MRSLILSLAIVAAGRSIHVRVDERFVVRSDGAPVVATVVDPVIVAGRVAVPAGAAVSGRVVSIVRPPAGRRVRDASGGDFTSRDTALVQFDTLTLADGTQKRILSRPDAGRDGPAAGKREWLKEYVLGQLPYHRRYVHAGAEYTVTLVEPVSVDIGTDDRSVRLEPNATSGPIHAQLLTSLDSSTAGRGDAVRVMIDDRIVEGTVTDVRRAGFMHRHGRLEVAIDGRTGVVTVPDSRWRFALPMLAIGAMPAARDADRGHLGNVLGRGGAGWSGFEMIGAAISQASGPAALGFGAWGVARGIWINVLGRGRDVVLPADTIVDLSSR